MAGSRDEIFARLLDAEGAALRRLAAAYEADAGRREDLVQETCVAIWTALPRFRGASSLRTFVFKIAHNQALKHVARDAARVDGGHGGRQPRQHADDRFHGDVGDAGQPSGERRFTRDIGGRNLRGSATPATAGRLRRRQRVAANGRDRLVAKRDAIEADVP